MQGVAVIRLLYFHCMCAPHAYSSGVMLSIFIEPYGTLWGINGFGVSATRLNLVADMPNLLIAPQYPARLTDEGVESAEMDLMEVTHFWNLWLLLYSN
ncbi:hypothetical protein AcW1_010220 [Taiwanofungus camphoratus]|nr:hypothetical protein AcW1_010220 [Antrodia cinnamomea]